MTATAMRAGMLALLTSVIAAAALSPARAETIYLKADLKPVAGTDSKAVGSFTAEYDTDTQRLTWRGSYSGIGSYATGGSLRGPASADAPRGAVVRLRSIDSPFEGSAIVSAKQAPDLIAGRWFILIRTAAHPGGELRGEIVQAN